MYGTRLMSLYKMTALAVASFTAAAEPDAAAATETATPSSPLQFRLGVSSAGLTGEFSYRMNDYWTFRGTAGGGLSLFLTDEVSDVRYDGRLYLDGVSLGADFHPFANGFRASAGLFITDRLFTGHASGLIDVGGTVYNASIRTDIELDSFVAPFMSVGYDWRLGEHVFLSADAGALIEPRVNAKITQTGGPPINPGDIATETLQIENRDLPVIPVLRIALTYAF